MDAPVIFAQHAGRRASGRKWRTGANPENAPNADVGEVWVVLADTLAGAKGAEGGATNEVPT